jgi:hypothetical protein
MPKINEESLAHLVKMCGASKAHCRKALAAEEGNVPRAFKRLIIEGNVQEKELNPDLATAEDYAFCILNKMAENWKKLTTAQQKIMGDTYGTADTMRAQFRGEVPITKFYRDIGILHRNVFLEKAHPEIVDGKLRPTAELKPFPKLILHEQWEGKDTFKNWAGFCVRQSGTETSKGAKATKGAIRVHVAVPGGKETPPNHEQVAAYRFLKEHEAVIARVILERIFAEYPAWREDYDFDEDEQEFMPAIKKIADLRKLIELENIHVLSEAKEGQAYVGFEFRCKWDEEHGLGIMTHKSRIVALGGADVSFLEWIAKKDGSSRGSVGK